MVGVVLTGNSGQMDRIPFDFTGVQGHGLGADSISDPCCAVAVKVLFALGLDSWDFVTASSACNSRILQGAFDGT
jgi:hypothetical protein